MRGHIKQALLYIGYPAEDLAGYVTGEALAIHLREVSRGNHAFSLRAYQTDAAEAAGEDIEPRLRELLGATSSRRD